MEGLQLNPPPGSYDQNQQITLSYDPDLYSGVIYTIDGSNPSYSKVICYDTSGRPFISVIEDNNGNIVFDGGFPKFYKAKWAQSGNIYTSIIGNLFDESMTTWDSLPPQGKYAVNVLNYITNKNKKKSISNL